MLKKLRVKFVCFTMAIVTVMLCVIFGTVYHFTALRLESESLRMMQAAGSAPFQPGGPNGEFRLPYLTIQVNQRGEIMASGGEYFGLTDHEVLMDIASAAYGAAEETGVLEQYDLRYCRLLGPMQTVVFSDISAERAALRSLVETCAVIGVVSLLAFFAISLLLAHIAVRPVDKAWKQQRQFVADASHELKTPLTVIMTGAELLQSGGCGEAERERLSGSILTMSRQMRGLVEGLLDLARADNGAVQMTFAPLEYSALVSDAVLPFEPLYFEQGLGLECRIEPGVRVKGSVPHLQQVVDILLDNALKYSTPGGTVRLTLGRQGKRSLLTVASPGEAISKEDRKNIFKRFYRIDKARSANGSYGLGLSIAREIVSSHKGRIWAQSADGWNTFFVQI